ncbi:MAG: hypothetical protein MZV63_05885 [Marinilabiliales bacterium]|nr:hypothetical protein [Marinilabiliales bacterium]
MPDGRKMAAAYVDILQIPAFLVRQADLVVAAAKTGEGGQFPKKGSSIRSGIHETRGKKSSGQR